MVAPALNDPLLVVHALDAGHGGTDALADLGFTLDRGEWMAVVGANGSGKSTLLDVVGGRLAPRRGHVCIAGHDLAGDAPAARHALGYAIAGEAMPPLLTGRQCIAVHAAARGIEAGGADVADLVEAFGIGRWLDDPVALMSYGTRQKFGVVLAFVGAPPLLVLDESFNGLDPASSLVLQRRLRAHAKDNGGAVLLATHALDLVERCADRALMLHEGRLVRLWSRAAIAAGQAAEGGFEAVMAQALATG